MENKDRADLDNIIKSKVDEAIKHASTTGSQTENDRSKEVIVSGFDNETNAIDTEAVIVSVLNKCNRRDKATRIFSVEDPTNFGVIEFTTHAAKNVFFSKRSTATSRGTNTKTKYFASATMNLSM